MFYESLIGFQLEQSSRDFISKFEFKILFIRKPISFVLSDQMEKYWLIKLG